MIEASKLEELKKAVDGAKSEAELQGLKQRILGYLRGNREAEMAADLLKINPPPSMGVPGVKYDGLTPFKRDLSNYLLGAIEGLG